VSSKAALAVKPKETAQAGNAVIESELHDFAAWCKTRCRSSKPARVLKAQQLKMEALEEDCTPRLPSPRTMAVGYQGQSLKQLPLLRLATHRGRYPLPLPARTGEAREKPAPLYFKLAAADSIPSVSWI